MSTSSAPASSTSSAPYYEPHDMMDPDSGYGIHSQEIAEYMRMLGGRKFNSAADFKTNNNNKINANDIALDPIPEYIPAQFRPEVLDSWIRQSEHLVEDAFRATRYIIRDQKDIDRQNKMLESLKRYNQKQRPNEIQQTRALTPLAATMWLAQRLGQKKGILNRQPDPMQFFMCQVMKTMRSSNLMFEEREDIKEVPKFDWFNKYCMDPPEKYSRGMDFSSRIALFGVNNTLIYSSVSNFLVKKPGSLCPQTNRELYRFIVDGRWTNTLFDPKEDYYSVFTIEECRQVISNLSVHDNWYVANLDLRHWFHQLPLPERYSHLFLMRMQVAYNDAAASIWTPRFCPMGWVKSPPIAQSVTWGLLLAAYQGRISPSKLDIPRTLTNYTSLPRWLPFESGGGIFVMLDNVLIISPKQEVRDAWYEQFYEKCKLSHAVIKVKPIDKKDDPPLPFTDEFKKLLDQQSLMTMEKGKEGDKHEFEFMGIQWGHSYNYLAVPDEERQLAAPPGTRSDDSWHGTHRELASILGKLNWHRRIYDLKSYDDSLPAQHIRAAYEVLTPLNNRWSSMMPEPIPSEKFAGIIEAWKFRNQQTRQIAKPRSLDFGKVLRIATDASSSGKRASAVFFGNSASSTPHAETWAHEYGDHRKIATAELLAIHHAVLSNFCNGYGLILLATDSMTCKSWIERGVSPTVEANKLLKEIFDKLDSRCSENGGQRLFVTYVPSEHNVADEPSRNEQLSLQKAALTYRYLDRAFIECSSAWRFAGRASGATSTSLPPSLTPVEEDGAPRPPLGGSSVYDLI